MLTREDVRDVLQIHKCVQINKSDALYMFCGDSQKNTIYIILS